MMPAQTAGAGADGPRSGYRFRGDVAVADAAFEAWGPTIEELFAAAADATMATMVERLDAIGEVRRVPIRIEEAGADLLLFRLLEELVYLKDAEGLLVRVHGLRVTPHDGSLRLEAEARGEPIDPGRHRLLTDVKAVTLHRLRVEKTARGWEAFVVLDL